jgi:uncharacterized oxidoreductase
MNGSDDPRAMPLKDYVAETVELLKTQPTPAEISVKSVQGLRFAVENGKFDAVFNRINTARPDGH